MEGDSMEGDSMEVGATEGTGNGQGLTVRGWEDGSQVQMPGYLSVSWFR
jgi:hypothetical protein